MIVNADKYMNLRRIRGANFKLSVSTLHIVIVNVFCRFAKVVRLKTKLEIHVESMIQAMLDTL